MKTSTMIIIAAVVIVMGCLTAFNYNLKGEYVSGEYKSRFKGMDFTSFKGIEKLDLQDANLLGIRVQQGDEEGVWINKDISDQVRFKVNAGVFTLTVNHGEADAFTIPEGEVIIVTKTLNAVKTSPDVLDNKKRYRGSSEVTISGYQLDRLDLEVSKDVRMSLNNMKLNTLHAVVGDKTHGSAELLISSDTKINTAQMDLPGASRLTLLNPTIVKSTYNLCDSATVTLSGKSVHLIR